MHTLNTFLSSTARTSLTFQDNQTFPNVCNKALFNLGLVKGNLSELREVSTEISNYFMVNTFFVMEGFFLSKYLDVFFVLSKEDVHVFLGQVIFFVKKRSLRIDIKLFMLLSLIEEATSRSK